MAHEPSDAGRRGRLLAKRHRELVSLEEKITQAEDREKRMSDVAHAAADEKRQSVHDKFPAARGGAR